MKTLSEQIYELGIVPVVKLDTPDDAIPLAKALLSGGLRCIEVTFRSDAAEESIRRISNEMPEMLTGAGTVLTAEQADRAVKAGAKFIVTPGFNPKVVHHCIDKGYPIFPGCNNPSDIDSALELGLTDLKFFPAEASGGLNMIKSLCGPFTTIRFIPTGGINEDNLNEYLAYNKIIACGGTWMVKETLIQAGKFDEIEALTRGAIQKMLGFELQHIGFNCENEEAALKEANKLCALFDLPLKVGNSSIFAGTEFEIMKKMYLGKNGHICMAVNSVDRAYAYLQSMGYEFNNDTIGYDDKGHKKVFYLKEEIGGFAIHLANK